MREQGRVTTRIGGDAVWFGGEACLIFIFDPPATLD
jgi:hypothetical protein